METIDVVNEWKFAMTVCINARRLCLSQKSCDKCPLSGFYPCGSNIVPYINTNGTAGLTMQINIITDWVKQLPKINANLI